MCKMTADEGSMVIEDHSHDDEDDEEAFRRRNSSFDHQKASHASLEPPRSAWSRGLEHFRSHWYVIVFGQILAFLLAANGATQASLKLDCNLSAPAFTIGLFYVILTMSLIPSLFEERYESLPSAAGDEMHQPKLRKPYTLLGIFPLQAPALKYLPMAIIDVYANYFTVMAFKYTTITSVTLLDALAIPSSLILSKVFLGRKYEKMHLLGVMSCIIGIVCNFMQDYEQDRKAARNGLIDVNYPHKLRGDVMAALGGILFGVNNCLQEHAVRNIGSPDEYNGVLGFFAAIISLTQALFTERDDIAEFVSEGDHSKICSEANARWLLIGFIVTNMCSYVGGARFLQISEATFMNLSFLTADLWSVIFAFLDGSPPHAFFFVALTFTLTGVAIYEMAPSPVLEDRAVHVESDLRLETNGSVELHELT